MLVTQLLFVSLLYPSHCLHRHCQPPLRPPYFLFETVRVSRQLEILPNPEYNLLYQMWQIPCLEMEYFGGYYSRASEYRIYGTCNYQRMFRFTMHLTYYSCWRMDLNIWDRTLPEAKGFKHHRVVTEQYDIEFGAPEGITALNELVGNSSRSVMFVLRNTLGRFSEEDIHRIYGYSGLDAVGTYAKIPSCVCSNRSQIELWSGRGHDAQSAFFLFGGQLFVLVAGLTILAYGVYQAWIIRCGRFQVKTKTVKQMHLQ